MTERDVHALRAQALERLAEATRAANDAPDVESALRYLTAATREVLGDKEAHLRPGGLRAGERQFVVACIFLITADRQQGVDEPEASTDRKPLRAPLPDRAWCGVASSPTAPLGRDHVAVVSPLP
jgi:hypothetical protein